jgi:hypothetical protein
MPPPSISFTSFPVFNFPDYYSRPAPLSGQVLLAQANPRPGEPRTVTDAIPVPPPSTGIAIPPPPAAVYSLSQLTTARQERDRVFIDSRIFGSGLERWNSERNTTYQSISVSLLRMRYFLQASQTDTASILYSLQTWYRSATSGSDPLFREAWQRAREALRLLQESPNRERAEVLLHLMDRAEASVPAVASPQGTPSPVAPIPSPGAVSPTGPSSPPSVGSGTVTPPTPSVRPPVESVFPTVRPVSFTSTSREVSNGDALMRDLRDHGVRSVRQAAERYTRSSGRSVDFTLRLHIQYNNDGAGIVFSRNSSEGDPALVMQLLQAIARDLPRFRGHGGDAVEVPIHLSIQ